MRNFIIFFQGREGTSPLVREIDNFNQVSIVHQSGNDGWEPFNRHNCGSSMALSSLFQCFDYIYSSEALDLKGLNEVYTKTATKPLADFDKKKCVGFKMRFFPPGIDLPIISQIPYLRDMKIFQKIGLLRNQMTKNSFKRQMFDVLKKHNIVVFVAVRQDVFRWGLSKYHGDGKGGRGHLQFKLAAGEIQKKDIPKLNVDKAKLESIIKECEKMHEDKKQLINDLKQEGVDAYPLFYEDYLEDKTQYYKQLFKKIEVEISDQEITEALAKGSGFKKVHSNDISEFVINHKEIIDDFQNRYSAWC